MEEGQAGAGAATFSGSFDLMAFNETHLEDMRAAVSHYIEDVNAHMTTIQGFTVGADAGVYGSAQATTIDGYIDNTCEAIASIVRYFDGFNQALGRVSEQYERKQANINVAEVAAVPETPEEELVTVNEME